MSEKVKPWGSDEKYYAVQFENAKQQSGDDPQSKHLAEMLFQRYPDLGEQVERAYRQWNNILRDYLRTETALRLSVGEDVQSVPVRIAPGLPEPLRKILGDRFDEVWLLLFRPLVTNTSSGMAFIDSSFETFSQFLIDKGKIQSSINKGEFQRATRFVHELKNELDQLKFVKELSQINQDILGAYFFNIPEIKIYYLVIGLMAAALDVSPESLTIVVLAHELTHAYTHLGRDIDGYRWEKQFFRSADLQIVEGLAQFYTQVLCTRLAHRIPDALKAYTRLLELQSGPYTVHKDWFEEDKKSGEVLRGTMIQARRKNITEFSDFCAIRDTLSETI